VLQAYHRLGTAVSVAVRSSGISADCGASSFAGMNVAFTNVIGDEQLLARITDCWASLYAARSLAYRLHSGVQEEPAIAVIVRQMIESDRSGILFTADPTTGEQEGLIIEAILGQGEAMVSGMVEPDTYAVSKHSLTVDVGACPSDAYSDSGRTFVCDELVNLSERAAGLASP
jgi:pyruvate,water dikinase